MKIYHKLIKTECRSIIGPIWMLLVALDCWIEVLHCKIHTTCSRTTLHRPWWETAGPEQKRVAQRGRVLVVIAHQKDILAKFCSPPSCEKRDIFQPGMCMRGLGNYYGSSGWERLLVLTSTRQGKTLAEKIRLTKKTNVQQKEEHLQFSKNAVCFSGEYSDNKTFIISARWTLSISRTTCDANWHVYVTVHNEHEILYDISSW